MEATPTAPPLRPEAVAKSDAVRALEADGWAIVDEAAPDPKLVAYDPALLDGHERELRSQIASTAAREKHVGNLAVVARRAREAETRAAAIDALGRLEAPAAQRALLALLPDLDRGDPARRSVAPLLHPVNSDDPFARELARRIDDPALEPAEREQIAFTLALVAVRDGRGETAPFRAELSPAALKTLERAGALAGGEAPSTAGTKEAH